MHACIYRYIDVLILTDINNVARVLDTIVEQIQLLWSNKINTSKQLLVSFYRSYCHQYTFIL